MHFAFTEDQRAYQEALRSFLAEACTPDHVRNAWDEDGDRSRWQRLGELGILGASAPEDAGGLGLSELDLVLLMEEAGRAALPEPFLEHAAVAIPILAASGKSAPRDRWMAGLCSGETMATVGLAHQGLVLEADRADVLLLERDGQIHAVPGNAVRTSRQTSVDGARRLFQVEWEPGDDTNLDVCLSQLRSAFDRGALAASAQLVGLGRAMVELSVEYAKIREQFGRPIGAFQAVQHHLVNGLMGIEFAAPLVYRAAWSLAHGREDASVHVSMAKSAACDAADQAARIALQVHGAIGYSFECDLHLWMKRAWALGRAWGDAPWHRERIARSTLDP